MIEIKRDSRGFVAWNKADLIEIKKRKDAGETTKAIAKELGITSKQISGALRRAGLSEPNVNRETTAAFEKIAQRAFDLRNGGLSYPDIMRELEWDRTSTEAFRARVVLWVKRTGAEFKLTQHGRVPRKVSVETFRRCMVDGETHDAVAASRGLSRTRMANLWSTNLLHVRPAKVMVAVLKRRPSISDADLALTIGLPGWAASDLRALLGLSGSDVIPARSDKLGYSPATYGRIPWTRPLLTRTRNRLVAGTSYSEIAEEFGCKISSVKRGLRYYSYLPKLDNKISTAEFEPMAERSIHLRGQGRTNREIVDIVEWPGTLMSFRVRLLRWAKVNGRTLPVCTHYRKTNPEIVRKPSKLRVPIKAEPSTETTVEPPKRPAQTSDLRSTPKPPMRARKPRRGSRALEAAPRIPYGKANRMMKLLKGDRSMTDGDLAKRLSMPATEVRRVRQILKI